MTSMLPWLQQAAVRFFAHFIRIQDTSESEPSKTYGFQKPKRFVNRVFVHCTASDHGHHDNLGTLHQWHVVERGWSAIGYHYLITFDGQVLRTDRDLERTPAAQKGHNRGTIAIALSGGQNGKTGAFTAKQFQALKALCHEINAAYEGRISFHGHDEVAPGRACPVYSPHKVIGLDARGFIKGE